MYELLHSKATGHSCCSRKRECLGYCDIILITKDCRGLSLISRSVFLPLDQHRATSLNNLQFILIFQEDLFLYSHERDFFHYTAVATTIIHPKHIP